MSIKSKVFAAAAALTLVGGVGAVGALTAGTADAATPSCGGTCVDFFSQEFGSFASPNFVLDTLRQGDKAGQPQILFRTSNSDPAEDYTISDEGFVSDFYTAGLVSPAVALRYGGGCEAGYDPTATPPTCTTAYPNLSAYEIEYSLQPCGASAKTVWIIDSATADTTAVAPLINGSDTNFSQPFVLTYPTNSYPTDMPRAGLYVTNLTGTVGTNFYPTPGTVNSQQLWGEDTGPLT
jgi:hypothetical protein